MVFGVWHQPVRDLAGEARVDPVIAWRNAGGYRHRAQLRRAQPDDGMIGAGQKALPPTLHADDEIPRVKRHQLGPSSGGHLDELAPMFQRSDTRPVALLRRL